MLQLRYVKVFTCSNILLSIKIWKIHATFYSENLKGNVNMEDLTVDGRIVLTKLVRCRLIFGVRWYWKGVLNATPHTFCCSGVFPDHCCVLGYCCTVTVGYCCALCHFCNNVILYHRCVLGHSCTAIWHCCVLGDYCTNTAQQ
jgi:hypothetical protein